MRRRRTVARKTVLVCDSCGSEVDEGKGAVMRVTYTDQRLGIHRARVVERDLEPPRIEARDIVVQAGMTRAIVSPAVLGHRA